MATYSRKRKSFAIDDECDLELPAPSVALDTSIQPLTEKSFNALANSWQRKHVAQQSKKTKYTQMTIDLGGNPQKRCKECNMEYVSTSLEDAALHKRYHARVLNGLKIPARILDNAKEVFKCPPKSPSKVKATSTTNGRDDVILEVKRTSDIASHAFVRAVLDVVEEELGAVRTDDTELWSQAVVKRTSSNGQIVPHKSDRYKAYLYINNGVCVGCCLAESISTGYKVLKTPLGSEGCAWKMDEQPMPASVGISRIWTLKEFRGCSVASDLLDASRRSFFVGRSIPKEKVAFSQPTESGTGLATAWFGEANGWLMYTGHNSSVA